MKIIVKFETQGQKMKCYFDIIFLHNGPMQVHEAVATLKAHIYREHSTLPYNPLI